MDSVENDPWLAQGAPETAQLPKALGWSLVGCAILSALIVASLLVFAFSVGSAGVPGPATVPGEQLGDRWRSWLVSEGLLAEDEELLYFYSGALFHVRERCVFFTPERLVYLAEDEELGGPFRHDVRLAEIEELEFHDSDAFVEDSQVFVRFALGERNFDFALDTTGHGDEAFDACLRSAWVAARPPGPPNSSPDTPLGPR